MSNSGPRQQAFDHIRSSTYEVVTAPPIAEQLGDDLTGRIVDLVDNAFIPEVRRGRITVPRDQLNADNVAILPVMPGEQSFDYGCF